MLGEQVMSNIQTTTPDGARTAIDKFLSAFNAMDGEGIRDSLNFPHTMIAGNKIDVTATAADFVNQYTNLAESEGWHHTTLDSIKATQASTDKVHFELKMSRCHADGTVYMTIPGLWIVTEIDGKWGIQVRSMFR